MVLVVGNLIYFLGWFEGINSFINLFFFLIGFGDFFVYYVIVFGFYIIMFIFVKGVFDVCGFKFMLDKKDFGYSFFCDGFGCGGICDILVWDVFYFVVFWEFNIVLWIVFYFYWKYFVFW